MRGELRIYLGAAPGVGKTFAMLGEARRRLDRGTDVVVGYVETHGRARTAELLEGLEVVPRHEIAYRGTTFEEMDLDAVLARKPRVALVDELAHTNVPGSRNEKRWQDVRELLDAGIDVVSTLNIQHLESLNDVVESITGIQQRETIPDEVVRAAEQIELVDMTPHAIRRRMAHGNVYAPDKVDAALANYFRPGNLGALRELALLWLADRVDEALQQYRIDHEIDCPWETRERIVVAVTGAPSGEQLIRRAARLAERSHGELIGVHIRATDGLAQGSSRMLERYRQLLGDFGGEYREIVADDVVAALVNFAHGENATQLVLGATRRSRWSELTRGSVINRLIRLSGEIDVLVISTDGDEETPSDRPRPTTVAPLTRRRRYAGWGIAFGGTALLTPLLASARGSMGQGGQFLLYLVVVVLAATTGGAAPAVSAAILSSFALNWYFTPPLYHWTIDAPEDVLALTVFVVVGVLVGVLVTALARRSAESRRGRAEADALARIAAGMVGADNPLPPMLKHIRAALGIEGIALVSRQGEVIAEAGMPPDANDGESVAIADGTLRIRGELDASGRRVLDVFAAQLAAASERSSLREEAGRAEAIAAADALRTAILRAVSHDLRTPLASIKASVTSLMQRDVEWSGDAEEEFLATIDEEVDRLDTVVANLLDASRLEAGAVAPVIRPVAIDDITAAALASISGLVSPVAVDISPHLPLVRADAGLLERAIANLVQNADRVTPMDTPVQIAARTIGNEVQLRIIDHGPGVELDQRDKMFQPFQRVGDTNAGAGVGLGLTVARGIVEAIGGNLGTEDTPGGGLTMVITLTAAHA